MKDINVGGWHEYYPAYAIGEGLPLEQSIAEAPMVLKQYPEQAMM